MKTTIIHHQFDFGSKGMIDRMRKKKNSVGESTSDDTQLMIQMDFLDGNWIEPGATDHLGLLPN